MVRVDVSISIFVCSFTEIRGFFNEEANDTGKKYSIKNDNLLR
jgi:hypothetical protein